MSAIWLNMPTTIKKKASTTNAGARRSGLLSKNSLRSPITHRGKVRAPRSCCLEPIFLPARSSSTHPATPFVQRANHLRCFLQINSWMAVADCRRRRRSPDDSDDLLSLFLSSYFFACLLSWPCALTLATAIKATSANMSRNLKFIATASGRREFSSRRVEAAKKMLAFDSARTFIHAGRRCPPC